MAGKDKWYILEEFDEKADYSGRNILALTPQACYQLDKRGLKYSILEDFYDDAQLMRSGEKYFFEQLQWFKEFDAFLKSNIAVCRENDIDLAKAHYYQIAFFIDTLVIYSRIFNEFLKKTDFSHAVYACRKTNYDLDNSIYDLPESGQDLVRRIFLELCRNNKRAVELIYKGPAGKSGGKAPVLSGAALKSMIPRFGIKSVYNFFRYYKFMRLFNKRPDKEAGALFLHAGTLAMDRVITECMSNNWRIFFKEHGRIYSLSGIVQRKKMDLNNDEDSAFHNLKKACSAASGLLPGQDKILDWVNKECGADLRGLVIKFLSDFIDNICPETIYELQKVSGLLKREKIDFVIACATSERDTIGALLAAKSLGIKRVCFQHGCSALDFKAWHISELALTDIYFARDSKAKEYYQHYSKAGYTGSCEVHESSHYLGAIEKIGASKPNRADTVMYVPNRVFFGFRSLNNFIYPITWYYKLQKAIIDHFGQRKELKLIFKIGSNQRWAQESVVSYIKDKGYDNISVRTDDFYKCLEDADKVFFDYPSSAMYEAGAAGKSIMGLYPDCCTEWPGAVEAFGRSLKKYSSIKEAIGYIEDFLAADADSYRVKAPISDSSFMECLAGPKKT